MKEISERMEKAVNDVIYIAHLARQHDSGYAEIRPWKGE